MSSLARETAVSVIPDAATDPVATGLRGLYDRVQRYGARKDLAQITAAFDLAAEAHAGAIRKSGEPYIVHPLAVASLLADMQLDGATIQAALLHDTVEDTALTLEDIRGQMGDTVARLVDGVTKFSELGKRQRDLSRTTPVEPDTKKKRTDRDTARRQQLETLRKLFLSMAEDPRVVLIKLADRLHNMRTIRFMEPENQRRIAAETREIYAPLAGRLGVAGVKWELEDLAFSVLEPDDYAHVSELVAEERGARDAYAERVNQILREQLEKEGVQGVVSARVKHLYSIYRKLQKADMDISQVYDMVALRVLVESVHDCYLTLGLVHALWRPIPSRFKDYIAVPKSNGYQSLHTTVFCEDSRPTEIQIRTYDMHRVSEYGVATHWYYKEHDRSALVPLQMIRWVRQLMEWQKELSTAQELVDSMRIDVFEDQVFVFTPGGDIKDLPTGSTPVDFAYRIHSEVGNRCIGAKVNGRMVPLEYTLQNGDIVEILTTKAEHGPSRDWLNFVKSSTAQQRIRQWFKRLERTENIARGRDLLDKELKRLEQRSLTAVTEAKLLEVCHALRYDDLDGFFAAIGFGELSAQQVVTRLGLRPPEEPPLPPPTAPATSATSETGALRVMGVGDVLTRLASCCHPVPGDLIKGYITRGKGVTVHRADCANIRTEDEPERLVNVEWGPAPSSYSVNIRIESIDREGLLRDVATCVADEKINFASASVSTHDDQTATIIATLQVQSTEQLSRVLQKIERIRDVLTVERDLGAVRQS
jgi:GTP pyrophosphokinase